MKHIRTALAFVVLASLAMTATAGNRHHRPRHQPKKHAARETAMAPIALAAAPPEVRPMVGTWTLRNGDQPRTDIRMVFRTNGTFAFVGPNWRSEGRFRMGEGKLSLEWTSVDGSHVAPGTVKKDYPMGDDGGSFRIDQYTYYKLNR